MPGKMSPPSADVESQEPLASWKLPPLHAALELDTLKLHGSIKKYFANT